MHVRQPQGRYTVPKQDRIGHAIHHSVSPVSSPSLTEAQEIAIIKQIDDYHWSLDWGGFGYHTATFESGRSYLCGDWDGARAHVKDRNHELVGSVAIGNYVGASAPQSILEGLADCVRGAREHFGLLSVEGHTDWAVPSSPTACPGLIKNQIATILQLAEEDKEMSRVIQLPDGRKWVTDGIFARDVNTGPLLADAVKLFGDPVPVTQEYADRLIGYSELIADIKKAVGTGGGGGGPLNVTLTGKAEPE